ncbi:hypothetical protein VNO77_39398 [Canavalia gladiata]|uniref:Uncharacterized protein n=1 Tax=Canavalia gladiata TaxID=3824 RepID=A0AAN9KAE0_CANGL
MDFGQGTFIDEVDVSSKTRDPWRLYSVTQIEVKLVAILEYTPLSSKVANWSIGPLARKSTCHPIGTTMLQRIGIGPFLSVFNMIVSTLAEAKRVGVVSDHGLIDDPSDSNKHEGTPLDNHRSITIVEAITLRASGKWLGNNLGTP